MWMQPPLTQTILSSLAHCAWMHQLRGGPFVLGCMSPLLMGCRCPPELIPALVPELVPALVLEGHRLLGFRRRSCSIAVLLHAELRIAASQRISGLLSSQTHKGIVAIRGIDGYANQQ